jgi:DNA-binding transcriptional LysR family regulator
MLLFAAVVRENGFTSAGKRLGITKQTVSERVANLEACLGVRLLSRTTRRLRPTDAGAKYYERCAAIAEQIEHANDEVQMQHAEAIGLLRVSAPVLYGRRFLSPVVATYLGRYPKARVEVVLSDRYVDLIAEGFDLAVRMGALDDSSLSARKLGDSHVYYVASPDFLSRNGEPANLKEVRCVGTRCFETWQVHGKRTKIEPVLVVNDLEVACEAAIAGVGVARVPAIVCRGAVSDGRLRLLFGPEPVLRPPVYAVYPSHHHLAAKVRLFVDALAALVEPMRPLEPARTDARRRRSSS